MKRTDEDYSADHVAISMLLPWYVNKTLQATELEQVEQHVQHCIDCQTQVQDLQKLSVAVNTISHRHPNNSQRAFASLKERLQPAETITPVPTATVVYPTRWRRTLLSTARTTLTLAAAGVVAALVLSRSATINHLSTNDYKTLSNAVPAGNSFEGVRVIFKTGTSQQTIDKILTAVDARIVGYPDAQAIYSLRFEKATTAAHIADKLQQLRADKDIIFAEPSYSVLAKTHNKDATP